MVVAVSVAVPISIVFAIFMVTPPVAVALTLAIPAVLMIKAAMVTFPIPVIVSAPFPARSDPHCTTVGRVSPITAVPNVTAVYHVPIAVHPNVAWPRWNRSHTVHTRRRWSADSDSDGYLSFKGG
jgi:hypothetical protein